MSDSMPKIPQGSLVVRPQRVVERHGAARVARAWSSQKQLDDYLKTLKPENRDEARKNHTVEKGGDKGKGGDKEPTSEDRSAAKIPEGTKPSKSVNQLITTDEGRDMVTAVTDAKTQKSFAAKVKEHANPKTVMKKLADSAVREVRNVVQNTPTILKDCLKEGRKPSDKKQKWPKGCDEPDSKTKCSVGEASEREILYGSAVYAAGIGVATAMTSAVGVAAVGMVGAKAFLNSLTLHIGLGAYNSTADMGLLHAEVGQDVATVAGGSMAEAVSAAGTGAIPGLGSLFESLVGAGQKALNMLAAETVEEILQDQDMIRLAKDGDDEKLFERYVQYVTDYAVAKFEKGLSEAEIKSILEHEG